MANKFIEEELQELDTPIQTNTSWLKAKKIRLIIMNEDGSFKENFCGYPKSYCFDIKGLSYILVPKAIIKGKFPTLFYYFNNPFPIMFEFKYSKFTALQLRSEEQKALLQDNQKVLLENIYLDSETLNLAFNNKVMKGLYAQTGITAKHIVIILVVVAIVVLVFLQVFGVVDVFGMISGTTKK